MAHVNTVLLSIETPCGSRCVDLFRRPDGSYGFEEYRRDVEDGRGWFPIGGFALRRHSSAGDARRAAAAEIGWFAEQCGESHDP
jgi:hypothetical protein